jgi:hypothetical protein
MGHVDDPQQQAWRSFLLNHVVGAATEPQSVMFVTFPV